MFVKLLRYIFGYVEFSINGKFPERFLNINSRTGILLWRVKRKNGILTACTKAAEYKKLRHSAKKAEVVLKLNKKAGIPFYINKRRKRLGMVVGPIMFCVILYVLSLFVWAVDIENPTTNIDSNLLNERLKSYGVRPGVLRSSIDPEYTQNQILLENSAISWIGVNTGSSRIVVNIKGRTYAPIIEDEQKPCNLVASKDGQIVGFNISEGEKIVEQGQAVAKGDLLVSGVIDTYTETRTIRSKGIVKAETETVLTATVPFSRTERELTGKETRLKSIEIFGFEIPLFLKKPDGDYTNYYSEEKLSIFGYTLEIKKKNLLMVEYENVRVTLDEEGAKREAVFQVDELQRVQMNGAEIISSTDEFIKNENSITVQRKLICIENIAIEEEIDITI